MTDSSAASLIYVCNLNSDYKLIFCLSISHNHLLILFRNHHPFHPSQPILPLSNHRFLLSKRLLQMRHNMSRLIIWFFRRLPTHHDDFSRCGRLVTPLAYLSASVRPDTSPWALSLSKNVPRILVVSTTAVANNRCERSRP